MTTVNMENVDGLLRSTPFVLLDFTSPGCAPCRKIAQALPSLLESLRPLELAACEIDITTDPALAAKFLVLSVPTLILFKEGKEAGRFNSLPKTDALQTLLS